MLEFVVREDKARFGASTAGITAVRLIGGLQKEFMEWQAMNSVRMVPGWKEVKKGGDELEMEVAGRPNQSRNVSSLARGEEEDEDEEGDENEEGDEDGEGDKDGEDDGEDDEEDDRCRVTPGLDDEGGGGAGLYGAWEDEGQL